jgi:hypothetical protein
MRALAAYLAVCTRDLVRGGHLRGDTMRRLVTRPLVTLCDDAIRRLVG